MNKGKIIFPTQVSLLSLLLLFFMLCYFYYFIYCSFAQYKSTSRANFVKHMFISELGIFLDLLR